MESIGVRELRQAASVHLRAVATGVSFVVTDRGMPVARLVPASPLEQRLAELIAAHGLIPPTRERRRFSATAGLGGSALSDMVQTDRADRELFG